LNGQRAAELRFGDPRVHALFAAVICRLQPDGFANHHLREHVAEFLGLKPDEITPFASSSTPTNPIELRHALVTVERVLGDYITNARLGAAA
jgi:hypothetical protein